MTHTRAHTHPPHTHIHALGRTPLVEGSASRRDLYWTTHDTHKKDTSKPPTGFEPTIHRGNFEGARGANALSNIFIYLSVIFLATELKNKEVEIFSKRLFGWCKDGKI